MAALLIQDEIFKRGKEGLCENECTFRENMDSNGESSISSSDFLALGLSSSSSSFQDSSSLPSTSEASEESHKIHVKQRSSLSGEMCVCSLVLFFNLVIMFREQLH